MSRKSAVGWSVFILAIVLAVIALSSIGCTVAKVDDTTEKLNWFQKLPVVGEIPFVREGTAAALAVLGLWREILRRRQLRTVARSVNQAIQLAPEAVKGEIKAAQGPRLSALMKSYR